MTTLNRRGSIRVRVAPLPQRTHTTCSASWEAMVSRSLCTCSSPCEPTADVSRCLANCTRTFKENPRASLTAQRGPQSGPRELLQPRRLEGALAALAAPWSTLHPGAGENLQIFSWEKSPVCVYASDLSLSMQSIHRAHPYCFDLHTYLLNKFPFVPMFSSPLQLHVQHKFNEKETVFFLMLHSKDNTPRQLSLFGARLHCTLVWVSGSDPGGRVRGGARLLARPRARPGSAMAETVTVRLRLRLPGQERLSNLGLMSVLSAIA